MGDYFSGNVQGSMFASEPPDSPAGRAFANRPGLSAASSTDTQREAAALVLPASGTLRGRVFDAIVLAPSGLTDSELAVATGLNYNSFGPRRRELVELGLVRDSGERRPSLTPPHRRQIVWTHAAPKERP